MVALVLDGVVGFPSPTSFHLSPKLGACGRVPGWLVSHFLSFVSQFFSFVSQAGCLWSGSWLACLPLPFICLPSWVLVVGACGVLVVGFPAGLSPTSFHLSPSSFHLSPKLGACGRVPGWLVSHFLSFVSQFFSFVSQAGCLWSGSRLACLPLPFICLLLFICLPSWVLVVGFPAGLSPTSFHLSPNSFHLSPKLRACGRVPGWLVFICLPSWVLVVGFRLACLPQAGCLSSAWLVSHFLSFVSQFFSFVSQAGCLWSGSRLACLPLPFGFPAGLSPTSFHLSPSSFHLSPKLGAFVSQAGRLWSGSRLACLSFVSHFFSFPKQFTVRGSQCFKEWSPWCWMVWSGSRPACLSLPFICLPLLFICLPVLFIVSQAGCLWSGSWPACLPLPFICLPLLFRLGASGPVPGWLVSHFFFHLSLRLGACGRVPGWLVSHFLAFVSHFFPKQFTVRGSQFFLKMCPPFVSLLASAHFHWPCSMSIHLSPRSVTAGVRPFPLTMQHFYSFVPQICHWWCPPFSAGRVAFLCICFPGLSLLVSALLRWPCSISIRLSPRSVTAGVRPFPLAMQHFYSFVSQVCHCWCPPFSAGDATFLFICLPGPSLLVSALFCWPCSISINLSPSPALLVSAHFHWPCSMSIHLSPRSITAGVRPFLLTMQHFYSFVPQICHWWCPPFSAGRVAFLCICFPGLSLLVSALFRWPCSISIRLSPRSVTAGVRPCPLVIAFLFMCLPGLSLVMSAFFSAGHVAFLFFCLPGLSLVCPCLLAMKHLYSFVSQVRHCWRHVAFLFMCLSGLSLVVSALVRWP